MYTYNIFQWSAFFYIYCFIGWCFESAYVSLKKQCFVNRGFLRAPLLPIYGFGAIAVLFVTIPLSNNPYLIYFIGATSATILEYITGYAMERLFKVKYWDYSNQPFNLHGYITLSSSIAWGFLSIFLTSVMQPFFETLLSPVPTYILQIVVIAFGMGMLADTYLSASAALDFAKAFETAKRVKYELGELQSQLDSLRMCTGETILHGANERIDIAKEGIGAIKTRVEARLSSISEIAYLQDEYHILKTKFSTLKNKLPNPLHTGGKVLQLFKSGLLHGNPQFKELFDRIFDEN